MNIPGHPKPGWRYFISPPINNGEYWAWDTVNEKAYWIPVSGYEYHSSIELSLVLSFPDMPEVCMDPDLEMDEGL